MKVDYMWRPETAHHLFIILAPFFCIFPGDTQHLEQAPSQALVSRLLDWTELGGHRVVRGRDGEIPLGKPLNIRLSYLLQRRPADQREFPGLGIAP